MVGFKLGLLKIVRLASYGQRNALHIKYTDQLGLSPETSFSEQNFGPRISTLKEMSPLTNTAGLSKYHRFPSATTTTTITSSDSTTTTTAIATKNNQALSHIDGVSYGAQMVP